ncbi:MAG: cytochrome-c oxidase, cbb3-type subunit III [Alphaproteobacteria bacterium]|nr:cytochrome-c oxidase, cbb3-type subunit III [Alphaproteobacteria bacterium]
MADTERDELSGVETTGHEWDGIKELNNPLPRWWLWTFYACIAWALVYTIFYPAWPMIHGATKGILGYSSRANLSRSVAEAHQAQAQYVEQIRSLPLEQIRDNPTLFEFAVAGGRSAFAVNCVQCHGSGAAGGKGYPNLNDDDWLWGGSLEAIHTTLEHGVRYEADPQTRMSLMPAFGRDGILDARQIDDTAEYVRSLSKLPHDADAAARGAKVFAEQCAVCHGADGGGNREVGAPSLRDAIWLYGGDKATIVETITNARRGVMPAWSGKLDEATIKQLALYVHSLGGGEQAAGEKAP